MERLKIITTSKDHQHGDWEKGETGYIDGYVNGGNGQPLACVWIREYSVESNIVGRIVLMPTTVFKVIKD